MHYDQFQSYNFSPVAMSAEVAEASQSGYEDGGMGGPGAPTPLSALEVSTGSSCTKCRQELSNDIGCCGTDKERHSTRCRWRI